MLVSLLRGRLRRAPLIVVAAALWTGCGYTSSYVPPADGRARVIWKDDDTRVHLGGNVQTSACMNAVTSLMHGGQVQVAAPPDGGGAVYGGGSYGGGYWVPRYYGGPIVVVRPGFAPILPRPPLFSPSLTLARGLTRGAVAVPSGGGGGFKSGGGGGGGGDGWAYVVIAVVVLSSVIAILVSVIPPESAEKSANNSDYVNAFNDLARTPGSPCAYGGYPAYPEPPISSGTPIYPGAPGAPGYPPAAPTGGAQ